MRFALLVNAAADSAAALTALHTAQALLGHSDHQLYPSFSTGMPCTWHIVMLGVLTEPKPMRPSNGNNGWLTTRWTRWFVWGRHSAGEW
jgi:hypothetical protein